MKKALTALVFGALLVPAVSVAAPAKSEKQALNAIQFRQALLQLVRSNVGALGAMAKEVIPYDGQVMQTKGMRIEQLALMMEDYFRTDTTKFKLGTDALPIIWEQPEDFKAKIGDLTQAAQNLQQVAAAGDESQYRAAIGGVLKTCKGCHDTYKAE